VPLAPAMAIPACPPFAALPPVPVVPLGPEPQAAHNASEQPTSCQCPAARALKASPA